MMKTLFVWTVPFEGITNGGGLANRGIYEMARMTLGDAQIESYFINSTGDKFTFGDRLKRSLLSTVGFFNGLTPKIMKDIVEKAMDYDMVFFTSSLMGVIAKELRDNGYKGKINVFFHNVEREYFSIITSKFNPIRKLKIGGVTVNETYCCTLADNIVTFNERDSKKLETIYGRKADYIIPISIQDNYDYSTVDRHVMTNLYKPELVFIGSYFGPNVVALKWFITNILPSVNVRFTIVGKGMENIKSLVKGNPKIEVHSDVPELAPYYERADFIVSPIMEGSGMKTKTCEALMYGKNIIGTKEAFEGYDIDTNKVGRLCTTADEFISTINHFAQHPVPRFNAYSRQMFEEKYSIEATAIIFLKMISGK